jgi:hypothetical protein
VFDKRFQALSSILSNSAKGVREFFSFLWPLDLLFEFKHKPQRFQICGDRSDLDTYESWERST